MKDMSMVRKTLLDIIVKKQGAFDGDDWCADFALEWNDEVSELIDNAVSDVSRAATALKNKDDLELCVAIGRARTRFLDLSGFFRDICDDFETLVREVSWPEIPDNYVYEKSDERLNGWSR